MPHASLVDDVVAIAAIPAPTGAEGQRLAWLERRLHDAPGIRSRDQVGNLVWRWGAGQPEVAIFAHVDTVFPADVDHTVGERDGWLHGPGIGDNAAAVAVAVHAVEQVLGEATLAPGAVVFTVGEEGLGNLRGARHACAELNPAAVIALEGHGLGEIGVDAVGSVRARLTIEGPGGHSWWDRGRPSALHAMVSLLTVVLAEARPDAPVNLGRVEGGGAVNAIASTATATVEARSLDERALDAFADGLADLRLPAPLRLAVESLGRRPAGRLDRSHALLAAVRAVRGALGLPDVLADGSTDANAALAAGIPALTLGCANGHDMHSATERIEAASLAVGLAQAVGILRRLLA